jgi:hypothetical protein
VTAFQDKRQHVSRPQIPRAARYLQGLINAAAKMGWSAPAKAPDGYTGRGEPSSDLSIRLPSSEVRVTVRELDERGRPGFAFTTQTEYLSRTERTTVNKNFTVSGRLEVALTRGWEKQPILSQRDAGKVTLEDQLPAATPPRPRARMPTRSPCTPRGWRSPTHKRPASGRTGFASMPSAPTR